MQFLRLAFRKKANTWYILKFHLSSCVFSKIFSAYTKYIRFSGQSVLVNGKLNPEGGKEGKVSFKHVFRGWGGENPII